MIAQQGQVGYGGLSSDTTQGNQRLTREFATAVQDAHARYAECVWRGNVFSATTLSTGITPVGTLTTTAPMCLWNGSATKKAIIIATSMTYVSGTMPVGTMWYATCAANAQTAAPTGTAITPRNSELGNGSASSMLLLGTATVSTVATGLLRPVWSLLPYLATTAAPVPPQVDELAGLYHVLPNNTFCITGAPSGGSTPLCIFGMVWEEVPYDAPGKGV